MERRTPVFIVCSPLQRVGKTLIAQLLVEFFIGDHRRVAAFDLNPDGYELAGRLRGYTKVANVATTKGQMALFDQLVLADEVAKVVDVGYSSFEQFFSVMEAIGYLAEAHAHSVVPAALFFAEPDHRSTRAFAKLQERFASLPLVPVQNAGMTTDARARRAAKLDFPGIPLRIPALSPELKAMTAMPGFSFVQADRQSPTLPSALHAWTRGIFLQFRELELRLLLEEIKPALRMRA